MYLPSKTKHIYVALAVLAIIVFYAPFKAAIQNILIGISGGLIFSPAKTSQAIEDLKKENISLSLKLKEKQHLVNENQRLKKALGFKEEKNIDLQGAEIIAFLPSNWRRVITVNTGKDKNIKKGQLAIDAKGNLLGKVLEVRKDSSSIILAPDPDFNLSVFVGDDGFGLLKGNIRGAKILYTEDGDSIKIGERVWVKTPENAVAIEVGKISRIKKSSNSLFWDIDVSLNAKTNVFSKILLIK